MKTALITGATSGIGKEYAKALAKKGYDLILTGRREKVIKPFVKELKKEFKIKVDLVLADFSNKDDLNTLIKKINSKKEISILVNNAGFGSKTSFFEDSIKNTSDMVNTHVNAVIELTYLVAKKMIKKNEGIIINVSSLAAFLPFSKSQIYSSTKSFIKTFSETIYLELKRNNVKIQCLCPGFTKTDFHGTRDISKFLPMTSKKVVDISLKNLNKLICVPGTINKTIYLLSKVIPRKILIKLIRKI